MHQCAQSCIAGEGIMKRDEYLKMLYEDNETEKEPTKELHEAV